MTIYHWVGMVLAVISMVAYVTFAYANLRTQSLRGSTEARSAQSTALAAVRDAAVAHRDALASHTRIDLLIKALTDRWERETRELVTVAANLAAFDKSQSAALALIYSRIDRIDEKLDAIYKDGCVRVCTPTK